MRGRRFVVLSLAAIAACGDGSGPGRVTPNPGTFAGLTSQNRPFSFEVTAQGIASATIEYQLSGSVCGYTATVTIGSSTPVPISNGSFNTGSFQIGANTSMTATGQFTSPTQASGSASISDGDCGGSTSLTWNATRQ